MLSDRRKLILRALIEEYIENALPVGSLTLIKQYDIGVSSATVRNELSFLEDAGFVTQPHTSAGRIPTDAGYRAFVDQILENQNSRDLIPYKKLIEDIRSQADQLDDLLDKTNRTLARITDCLSIIMAPTLMQSHIIKTSIISISATNALVVIVFDDGQVMSKSITFDHDVSEDDLKRAESKLSSILSGHTQGETSSMVDSMQDASDKVFDVVVSNIADLFHEQASSRMSRVGMSTLMRKPEFQNSNDLLPIMEIIEDSSVLFSAFDNYKRLDDEIVVRIGAENDSTQLSGVSVISGVYGHGPEKGIIAVIGPKRMDYKIVIDAVKAASGILSEE